MPDPHTDTFAAAGFPVLLEQHGETAVYQAADGGEAREITVLRDEAKRDENQQQGGAEWERETVWVSCWRSETTERPGIRWPQQGDRLVFDDDPKGEPYTFQGPTRNVTELVWDLQFARRRITRYGPRQ